MNGTALPNTALCPCPTDGGCGRLIPIGTGRCHVCRVYGPPDCGRLHYGGQALAQAEARAAAAEAQLAFIYAIALEVQRYGDVESRNALVAAGLGDLPEELPRGSAS